MKKEELLEKLAANGYVANAQIAYTLLNAMQLHVPILLEGEPGVGKTELAKACAGALGLELLSDFSMSIPELGKTVTCPKDMLPIVFLTSNNTRELSDALRRRCIYLYMPNKTLKELTDIIRMKAEVSENFARQVAEWIEELRTLDLKQKPSVSEGISWAKVLLEQFGDIRLSGPEMLCDSVGVIAKNQGDCETVRKYLNGEE